MYELLSVGVGHEPVTAGFTQRGASYLKYQFASTLLFWTCLWTVKASFLTFFGSLTKNLGWQRRGWWAVTMITALSYVGSIITYPLACTSFELGKAVVYPLTDRAECCRCLRNSAQD